MFSTIHTTKEMEKKSLKNQFESLFSRLTGEGIVETSLIELAIAVRDEIKISPESGEKNYLKKRFNRLLIEMGQIDYNLTDEFYKKC